MSKIISVLFSATLLLLVSAPAQSTIITFEFTGTITGNGGNAQIAIGDAYSISYSQNLIPSAINTNTGMETQEGYHLIDQMTVNFTDTTTLFTSTFTSNNGYSNFSIYNITSSFGTNEFLAQAINDITGDGSYAYWFNYNQTNDIPNTSLTQNRPSTLVPALTSQGGGSMRYSADGISLLGTIAMYSQNTSSDPGPISTIPEPTSIALIAIGLFGLAASRRKKHQV